MIPRYRLAEFKDFTIMRRLLYQIDKTFPIPLSKKIDLDVLADKFLKKGYVYMALNGGLPVGMVGFYANNMVGRRAYISVVGVIEEYQHQGIAKKMVNESLAVCKEKGMTSCFLYTHKSNIGAIAMYQKLGFVAEEDPDRPHDIKFVKEL